MKTWYLSFGVEVKIIVLSHRLKPMTQHFFNIGITKKSCDRQLQLQDNNKNLCYGVIDRVGGVSVNLYCLFTS